MPVSIHEEFALSESPESFRRQLIGVWRCVSYKVTASGGTPLYPYGEQPDGLLMYDRSGYMSVQIMKPERPKTHRPGVESDEDLRATYNGYIAYFGKYSISPDSKSVIHHVGGSLQTWILGSDQVRLALLEGDRLVLSADLTSGIKTRLHEITWERVA